MQKRLYGIFKRDEADVAGLSGAVRVICVELIAVQSDEPVVCQVVVRDERLMVCERYRAVSMRSLEFLEFLRSLFSVGYGRVDVKVIVKHITHMFLSSVQSVLNVLYNRNRILSIKTAEKNPDGFVILICVAVRRSLPVLCQSFVPKTRLTASRNPYPNLASGSR